MNSSITENIPEKPLKKETLIGEEVDEGLEVLYTDTELDSSFSLNSTASAILELCDGKRSVDDISNTVCDIVAGNIDRVHKDTKAVLEEFYLHGLIR